MRARTPLLTAAALLASCTPTIAQNLDFERSVYMTCREAHALDPGARRNIASMLAEHAARHRGVTIPNDERGAQLALLVRGGCTMAPDAYLFAVIDRALLAELPKLPRR
jgi:hypothetical protein